MTTLSQPARQPAAWRVRQGGWLLLLASGALLALLVAGFFMRPRYGYSVDLREPELLFLPFELEGFNALERAGGEPYRWTTDYPFLQVRHAFHLAPSFRATLTIRSDRPDGPQPVTFLLNEQPLATVQTTAALRTYSLLLPNRPDAEGSLRVAAATKNLSPPGDLRRLGFITTSWSLVPQFANPWLGPLTWGDVGLVLAGGLALMAWLAWRGGRRTALLAGVTAIAGLLSLRILYRPAPLPFTHLALIALLGVGAIPWLTRRTGAALALALLALIVTFAGALWPSWITDDALISFRYAQNLHAGNGLVYNLHERVEGYTNFLWTMLAALVLALGGEPVRVSYYAGCVIALLVVGATFVLARNRLDEKWAVAAAALLGTSHSLLLYTSRGSGLETGLFALLLVIASHLFLKDRPGPAGAAFALATLTRPEGVLFLGIAALLRVVEHRRLEGGLWRMLGAFALPGVPFFIWRFAYYGDLLPNTFYAKTGGGGAQAWRGLVYAGEFALFAGGPVLALLLLPAVRLVRARPRMPVAERRWLLYSLAVVLLFTLYVVAVGGDHFPGYRFFTPVLPFLAVLLAMGARELATGLGGAWRRVAPALAIILVVGLSIFNLTRSRPFDNIVRGDDESVWLWRELGWWLADHGRPGESMAALGAGAIPYYSRHPTIDLLGLNDRYIARLSVEGMGTGTAGHEKRAPGYVLNERKPTYIPALWADYFGGEQALKATGLYQKQEIVTRYGRRLGLWKRVQ